MSNQTFLISLQQNNDLSPAAVDEIRNDISLNPLNQRHYINLAKLVGNQRQYGVNQVKTIQSPLRNKKILFLGSSVTLGFGALGESFVDYLWKKDGVMALKDAENGTTLIDQDQNSTGDSYPARFKLDLTEPEFDAFVIQLSTNDATHFCPKIGQVKKDASFDLKTVTGSLEFMISQAQRKWHCPILIFTNPYFDNPFYGKMVEKAHDLTSKFGTEILDLYHDDDFNENRDLYFADPIHPTRAGYLKLWLPKFENKLIQILQ